MLLSLLYYSQICVNFHYFNDFNGFESMTQSLRLGHEQFGQQKRLILISGYSRLCNLGEGQTGDFIFVRHGEGSQGLVCQQLIRRGASFPNPLPASALVLSCVTAQLLCAGGSC